VQGNVEEYVEDLKKKNEKQKSPLTAKYGD
jgi:hypothetical protein